ncbi:uncharacterized protein PAF06_011303 [Gastrophryne carolinensis]
MHRSSGTSERNMRDVVSENTELKKFHEQIKREVRTILSRHEGTLGRVVTEDTSGINKRGGGRAKPTRVGDAGFTGSLKKQWNSLKQLVEILETRATTRTEVSHVISVTDHEKELTRLKEELQELKEELSQSRELIGQQQQLLQDQSFPCLGEGQQSPLWDAYFLEEQLKLQEERAVFEEQKMVFQKEREKFTEAAIRLGHERLQFKSDQALFMKQQFLDMTPGVATPPWKRTPPWTAVTTGNSRHFTPRLTSADPITPSTAELYRVLRLAPPSRSVRSYSCHGGSQQDTESEEGSSRWSDSLSPRSDSPELQPLPQYVAPLRGNLSPYLRPRATPGSLPRNHVEPHTPRSTELYRRLHLTPSESVASRQKVRGDTLLRSLLHHSHRRASLSKATEAPCNREAVKCNEEAMACPYDFNVDGYETDSLHSDDMGHAMDQADSSSESNSLPREESEYFDDSLYRVTPLQETSHFRLGENVPHLRVDSSYCSRRATLTGQDGWPCEELNENDPNDGFNSNCIPEEKPKDTLHPDDRCRRLTWETPHPRDGIRSRSNEVAFSSRSREQSCPRERCPAQSKENLNRRNSLCHVPRPSLNFENQCPEDDPYYSNAKRRKSLESFHHQHDQARKALYMRGTCSSRSVRRRSSQHRRDSLYTSGPGRSPLHLRRSCPSVRNSGQRTSDYTATANLCADLLTQFIDCPL